MRKYNPKHTSKKKTDRRESNCLFLGNAVQLSWAGIHGYQCQNLFPTGYKMDPCFVRKLPQQCR
uniref:Uncharacterized protein n=1 Tax=Xiphophorus maculatus TaxID=8083 RepID=A0A3B5QZ36_XIPMA